MADADELVTVPVIVGFDHSKVIGELRVRRDALPAAPDYCFAIAYSCEAVGAAKEPGGPVEVTRHELKAVSIQSDESYSMFLAKNRERSGHG